MLFCNHIFCYLIRKDCYRRLKLTARDDGDDDVIMIMMVIMMTVCYLVRSLMHSDSFHSIPTSATFQVCTNTASVTTELRYNKYLLEFRPTINMSSHLRQSISCLLAKFSSLLLRIFHVSTGYHWV